MGTWENRESDPTASYTAVTEVTAVSDVGVSDTGFREERDEEEQAHGQRIRRQYRLEVRNRCIRYIGYRGDVLRLRPVPICGVSHRAARRCDGRRQGVHTTRQ
jgi:hypothetical protein